MNKPTPTINDIDFDAFDRWKEYIRQYNEAEVARMTEEERRMTERLYSAMDSVEDEYFG